MTIAQLNWQQPEMYATLQSYQYKTPVGRLKIEAVGTVLCKMEWCCAEEQGKETAPAELKKWLNDYWLAKKTVMPISVLEQGTPFQQQVWQALQLIPTGHTKTYGELARILNTSPRALANACRNNPFPLIIPCHRILAKTGLGGYAGHTDGPLIEIKAALLEYEKELVHEL